MKNFNIYGGIIDDESQRESFEDLTPSQFAAFAKKLDEGEALEIYVNSPGGSVTAGISIANQIKQLISEGHSVVCIIEGLAASIASVIACSCEKIKMYKSSLFMMHLPWGYVMGNAEELKKQANIMETMTTAIISFYKSKFDLSEEELKELMTEETWITANDLETFKFNAEILDDDMQFDIAAKLTNKHFKNIPQNIRNLMENEEKKEEILEEKTEVINEVTEETIDEENPMNIPEVNDEMVSVVECEKRVSGMQAKMQNQINDLVSQIKDFKVQIQQKDKELQTYKDECISLKDKLENTDRELQETASALSDKKNALDTLNANVNTPPKDNALPDFNEGLKACKTPKDVLAFIKSGKYKINK